MRTRMQLIPLTKSRALRQITGTCKQSVLCNMCGEIGECVLQRQWLCACTICCTWTETRSFAARLHVHAFSTPPTHSDFIRAIINPTTVARVFFFKDKMYCMSLTLIVSMFNLSDCGNKCIYFIIASLRVSFLSVSLTPVNNFKPRLRLLTWTVTRTTQHKDEYGYK